MLNLKPKLERKLFLSPKLSMGWIFQGCLLCQFDSEIFPDLSSLFRQMSGIRLHCVCKTQLLNLPKVFSCGNRVVLHAGLEVPFKMDGNHTVFFLFFLRCEVHILVSGQKMEMQFS